MPELWRIYGMRFFFYSREHEPMHVHVKVPMDLRNSMSLKKERNSYRIQG